MLVPSLRHPGYTPRRTAGLTAYERVLARAGLTPVAGIDEAGRGACAGPLVVASVALDCKCLSRLGGVADSKALAAAAREEAYKEVTAAALAWHVVVIPPQDIDRYGLHVCNIAGMRRALAGLACRPAYVLTDGFPVRGLGVPALAMWKGDEVATCVAAASVVAKVTRDRIMREAHVGYPQYGFARHKGYSTPAHMKALAAHGPCPEHRRSFVNVGCFLKEEPTGGSGEGVLPGDETAPEEAVLPGDETAPEEAVLPGDETAPGEDVAPGVGALPWEGIPPRKGVPSRGGSGEFLSDGGAYLENDVRWSAPGAVPQEGDGGSAVRVVAAGRRNSSMSDEGSFPCEDPDQES
jgi:ribonuclease HII